VHPTACRAWARSLFFSKVHQKDIGDGPRLSMAIASAECLSLFGKIVLMQADLHVGLAPQHPSAWGFGSFKLFISSIYSSTERTCRPRVVALLFANGGRRCRPCSRGPETPSFHPAI